MAIKSKPETDDLTQSIKAHFNNISSVYYSFVDKNKHSAGYCHRSELEFVLQSIDRQKKYLILDAGCGPGRHAVSLARKGHKVIALDFAFNMIKETLNSAMRENALGNIAPVNVDVRLLSFKDSSFDVIINMEVLEHLPGYLEDTRNCVKEFYRILKPGGILLIEVPLRLHYYCAKISLLYPWNWFKSGWKKEGLTLHESLKYYRDFPLEVDNLFRESETENILKESGFKIRKKRYSHVLQAGWFKWLPILFYFDHYILERMPLFRKLARGIIWLAEKEASGG